ncbi:glycogenin-2 isoform X2 [Megalops cyprinoides]|uniref:glycogenin-2 isoform X2 n=1 Tax=Megalops cyprinoides TaxID=118141 RepID=UPI00186519A1|nr:glycogenin-2 isoform X2 [Megalops cyprinoides]
MHDIALCVSDLVDGKLSVGQQQHSFGNQADLQEVGLHFFYQLFRWLQIICGHDGPQKNIICSCCFASVCCFSVEQQLCQHLIACQEMNLSRRVYCGKQLISRGGTIQGRSLYFTLKKMKLVYELSLFNLHLQHQVTDQAFVTLATNDVYSQGALNVGQCLRRHGTSRQIVALITPRVSNSARAALARVFHQVKEVDVLRSLDHAHLKAMGRPELGVTLTKLHCWTLTQYSKCVFLDADTLVLCNVDELFEREELSAAPDPGWPDCFNSGVFVFRPSLETHDRLLHWVGEHGSFDGGDQGILNSFFSDWATQDITRHLPFIYNLSTSTVYSYLPAFRQYGQKAKIIHFLGAVKPWHYKYNQQTGDVFLEDGSPPNPHLGKFLNQWWVEHCTYVIPLLEKEECQESEQVHHKDQAESGEVNLNKDPQHKLHKVHLSLHTDEAFTPTAQSEMEHWGKTYDTLRYSHMQPTAIFHSVNHIVHHSGVGTHERIGPTPLMSP